MHNIMRARNAILPRKQYGRGFRQNATSLLQTLNLLRMFVGKIDHLSSTYLRVIIFLRTRQFAVDQELCLMWKAMVMQVLRMCLVEELLRNK